MRKISKQLSYIIIILVVFTTIFTNQNIRVWAEEIEDVIELNDVDEVVVGTDSYTSRIGVQWSYNYEYWIDNFLVYRSTAMDGEYKLLATVPEYRNYYDDKEIKRGVTYYYKVVVYMVDENGEHFSKGIVSEPVMLPLEKPEIYDAKSVKNKGVQLSWPLGETVDEYDIYRSETKNGTYEKIGSKVITKKIDAGEAVSYLDKTALLGKEYYYKIIPIVNYEGQRIEGEFSDSIKGILKYTSTKITKAVSKKAGTNTITWKKVSDASGYIIYCAKGNSSKYKKIKTMKGNKKFTYTHKKLKNGVLYNYAVCAYKKMSYGTIVSDKSEVYPKYCDYYTYEMESWWDKNERIFGKKGSWYKTDSIARKHMKRVTIKVWDKSGGKWFTRKFTLTVNSALAPSVKKMFKEIYASKSRTPIHDIGCYSWRGNGSTSEHCIGTAFDINANENYMIENGKILAGSLWNPKKNQYSIPKKCKLVSIMKKYGFYRGFWGSRKDYMHFSYFAT